MIASAAIPAIWNSSAATKFQVPRQRPAWVLRPKLLRRLAALARDCRITLVCAPAGFGKSTLLAQFAAESDPDEVETAWLSLDEDDNDPNRLFVSLLGALQQIPLEWSADPQMLASRVDAAGPGARIAVVGLVNALCSYQGKRLLLIVDDLHCIADPGALWLLDALIDRLPPEVGLVIGTRIPPSLSLPRWRARGELGELLTTDLQFSGPDALALATLRLGGAVSRQWVDEALARTQGWAAGLQLLFNGADRPVAGPWVHQGRTHRHLFNYFAAEVLAALPPELRDFLLQCAILPELDPARCAAVTGRDDAPLALDELYRRNLFLTVLDDVMPVLRLHDLFRDFLLAELDRRHPGLATRLYARAAAAEPVSTRAVSHWLKAECWNEAVEQILGCAEPLLAEGGFALVERWLQQLPPDRQQQSPDVAYLKGLCHWARYDFLGMREPLERACTGYRQTGDSASLARILFMLTRSFQSTGDLASCAHLLEEANNLELDPILRSTVHSARAWQALADGQPQDVAPALQAMVEAAECDPATLFPAISDVFNSFLYGLPGTLAPLRRLRDLCADWSRRQHVHWMVEAMANTAWPDFWHGDRATAVAALEDQWRFRERMADLPALWLTLHQLTSCVAAAGGEFERAMAMEQLNLDIINAPEFGSLALWQRPFLFSLARVYWMTQDIHGMAGLSPQMKPARRPEEWPAVETGRVQILGQIALLEGRLEEAESALLQTLALYRRWRFTFMGHPRISLALLRLAQGDTTAAWAEFEPVLRQALAEDCIGFLLMEPREPLQRLLNLIPAEERESYRTLLERLAGWQSPTQAPLAAVETAADSRLSERELEVLQRIAAGDSNKQIARALDLSPHTVKRHVANILTKLDLSSRSQAAAWWRDHQE